MGETMVLFFYVGVFILTTVVGIQAMASLWLRFRKPKTEKIKKTREMRKPAKVKKAA